MSGRRLFAASSFSATTQGVALVVVLLLTPIQLRSMGAERYALVSLAAAVASYITLFDIGGGWPVMRYVPLFRSQGRPAAADEAFSVALVASIVVGMLGAALLWIIAPWVAVAFDTTAPERMVAEQTIRISGLWMPLLLCGGVLNGAARAVGKFRTASVISASAVIGLNILWTLIAMSGGSPQDVAIAQLGVSAAGVFTWIIVLTFSAETPRFTRPRDARQAGEVLRFSALSSVAQLGTVLLGAVGTLVIASGVGAASIVYYALPLSLAQRLTLVSSTVASVAFPQLSQDRGRDPQRNTELLRSSHALVTVTTGGLSVILIWSGYSALSLWISPAFATRAAGPLRILVVGFALASMSSIYQVHLEAVGKNAIVTALNLLSGLIGLVVCFLLSRSAGETGGAVGIALGLALLGLSVVGASIIFERTPRPSDIWWTTRTLGTLLVTGAAAHLIVVLAYDRQSIAGATVDLGATCGAVIGVATMMMLRVIVHAPSSARA